LYFNRILFIGRFIPSLSAVSLFALYFQGGKRRREEWNKKGRLKEWEKGFNGVFWALVLESQMMKPF